LQLSRNTQAEKLPFDPCRQLSELRTIYLSFLVAGLSPLQPVSLCATYWGDQLFGQTARSAAFWKARSLSENLLGLGSVSRRGCPVADLRFGLWGLRGAPVTVTVTVDLSPAVKAEGDGAGGGGGMFWFAVGPSRSGSVLGCEAGAPSHQKKGGGICVPGG